MPAWMFDWIFTLALYLKLFSCDNHIIIIIIGLFPAFILFHCMCRSLYSQLPHGDIQLSESEAKAINLVNV